MYFIREGNIQLEFDDDYKFVMHKGSFFGEKALFFRVYRLANAKTNDFCIISSFSKNNLEQLELDFPDITNIIKDGLSIR